MANGSIGNHISHVEPGRYSPNVLAGIFHAFLTLTINISDANMRVLMPFSRSGREIDILLQASKISSRL